MIIRETKTDRKSLKTASRFNSDRTDRLSRMNDEQHSKFRLTVLTDHERKNCKFEAFYIPGIVSCRQRREMQECRATGLSGFSKVLVKIELMW